jgi:glycolate oxidase FAD binding subunit
MHALAEVAERVREAAGTGRRLRLRGAGTKDHLAGRAEADILDLRGHAGIVDYEPSELFVTVRAGTALAELESVLALRGQCLPFEPPHFSGGNGGNGGNGGSGGDAGGTVGGMVAAGLAGPARAAVGGVRDFVLGALVLDGRGELLRFGGTVMKNVAGYDVARAFAGSWGALGAVCEVSLKVLPAAPADLTLGFELDQRTALERVNAWCARPLPVNASAWWRGTLKVRLRGARAAVAEAARRLGGEALAEDAARDYWRSLRDQHHEFFVEAAQAVEGGRALWRLSLPSTTSARAHGGDTLVEWGGAQRWVVGALEDPALADFAAQAGGSAQRVRGGPAGAGMHPATAPAPALQVVQRRLRAAFDPRAVFVPGRPVAF